MRTALPLLGLNLLGLTLLAAPAAGQAPASQPAASQPTAEQRLREALGCYARFDLDCALRLLGEAQTLAEDRGEGAAKLRARIHLHQGVCHGVLNHPALADRAFELALTHDPAIDLDPEHFKPGLVSRFRSIRARLSGTLTVIADGEGATVTVDGVRVGLTPFSGQLPVGAHQVQVSRASARAPHVEQVVIPVGGTVHVRARLGPAVAAQPGASTRRERPVHPGPQTRRRFWTWAAAGAAVITLAVAIGLGSAAAADYRAWEDEYGKSRQRWDELRESAQAKATGANVLFGTGGALAVTALVLFLVEGRPAPERATTLGPTPERATTPGPAPGGSLGLSLTRSF